MGELRSEKWGEVVRTLAIPPMRCPGSVPTWCHMKVEFVVGSHISLEEMTYMETHQLS